MIKAIFLDIDGTMVSFETHRVPENTKNVLREARKRGVKVFVSTGRHGSDIINLDNMMFDGYITLNGAYCKIENEVVFKKSIPREDIEAFVRYEEDIAPIPCYFMESDSISANMKHIIMDRMREFVKLPLRPIIPSKEFLNKEIFQMTAFFPIDQEEEIMKHLPGCVATRWYPTFADINAGNVDKGIGLMKIGEYFGFAYDEMMAFGDGGNDISMIKYAGVGIAMGNAGEDVKHAADYVTTSVDDDGVGNALRYYGVL